jgi:hypothetical protein
MSDDFNPYDLARWDVSENQIVKMQKEIDDEVARSGLPTAVKDQLADRSYDRSRPYRQELLDFIEETSLYEAMQVMRAASTALRNSDHVDGPVKRELLDEVIETWLLIVKLLVLLTPSLVANRFASFDNVVFLLANYNPDRDPLEYMGSVLSSLPYNVVRHHEKELASRRMAPLFFEYVERTENRVAKLMMLMCVLRFRPRGWVSLVRRYMLSQDKNSFYLGTVYGELRRQLAIGFLSEDERSEIRELVGVAVARHAVGAKKPNRKLVEKYAKATLGND